MLFPYTNVMILSFAIITDLYRTFYLYKMVFESIAYNRLIADMN